MLSRGTTWRVHRQRKGARFLRDNIALKGSSNSTFLPDYYAMVCWSSACRQVKSDQPRQLIRQGTCKRFSASLSLSFKLSRGTTVGDDNCAAAQHCHCGRRDQQIRLTPNQIKGQAIASCGKRRIGDSAPPRRRSQGAPPVRTDIC